MSTAVAAFVFFLQLVLSLVLIGLLRARQRQILADAAAQHRAIERRVTNRLNKGGL